MMLGEEPGDDLFAEVGQLASMMRGPEDDVRGPAEYKRAVVKTYTKRGLAKPPWPGPRGRDAMQVALTVNGTEYGSDVEPRTLLVDFIRSDLGLTGTHIGCDTTSCGVCTVLVDGKSR